MSLFTSLVRKSFKKALHFWRKHLLWLLIIAGVLISANFLINHYVGKVVAEQIETLVLKKSGGLYRVSWDKIGFVVNQNRFYLQNFDFKYNEEYANTTTLDSLKSNYLFDAEIESLNLDIHDFWSVIFLRKLRVEGIGIDNPQITVLKLRKSDHASTGKISLEAGNLYKLLSGQLNELRITDFRISNGRFTHTAPKGTTTENFRINNLTFEVKNFLLSENAATRDDKFLFTDDIYVELTDQNFLLKDSLHQLSFDRFYISVANNKVGFENVQFRSINAAEEDSLLQPSMDIKLPTLQLSGVDFIRAYNEGELLIDSIVIASPTIHIDRWAKQKSGKPGKSPISQLIANHARLNVRNFDLRNASISFSGKDKSSQYQVDQFSAFISGFVLDTAITSQFGPGMSFNDIALNIRNFKQQLSDNTITQSVGEITLSANPGMMRIVDLEINQKNPAGSFSATLPYGLITGLDLPQIIRSDTVVLGEIYLENPAIRIANWHSTGKNKALSPAGLFGVYHQLLKVSRQFHLRDFAIKNGSFDLTQANGSVQQTKISVDGLDLTLSGILLDSLSKYKESVLAGAKLDMTTGVVRFENGNLSSGLSGLQVHTGSRILELSGVKTTVNRPDSMALSFPRIRLTGFLLDSMALNKRYIADTLLIDGDFMHIYLADKHEKAAKHDSVKTVLPEVRLKYLSLSNSLLDVRKDNSPLFSSEDYVLHVEGFAIDPTISNRIPDQFYFDRVANLSMKNYTFFMKEQQHRLKLGEVTWNDDAASFFINRVTLMPTIRNAPSRYFVDIPSISLMGIDLKRLLYDTYYFGDNITITKPRATFFMAAGKREKKQASLDIGFMPVFLRGKFSGIAFKSFKIQEAAAEIHRKSDTDSMLVNLKRLDLDIVDFKLDTGSTVIPERFLFASEVKVAGQYLGVYFPGKSDYFNINRFGVSTATGDIYLDGVYAATNTKAVPAADQWKFTADRLDISGLSFHGLTQNKKLDIDNIVCSNPAVKLVGNVEKKALPSEPGDAKFPLDTAIIDQLNIGLFSLNKGVASIDFTYDDKPKIDVPYIDFTARGIRLTPQDMNDKTRLFHSDMIAANVKNLRYELPNGLNAISVSSVSVNSSDSIAKISGLKLFPLVGKYEYGPRVGYQSTWLKLENDSIVMRGIDFLGIVNNNHLHVTSAEMDNFKILVFRDKRIEFPEWQRKNLPQVDLKKLTFTFALDTIRMKNGYLTYQEHAEKAKTPGEIFIQDINAKIKNATNDSSRLAHYSKIDIEATAFLFGSGKLRADFQFDMAHEENIHQYGIVVDSLDLTEFNRIMIPNAAVRITGGTNHKILMSAKANEDYSYGEMRFYYNDLKIALINRDTETTKGLGQVLGSFFANTFIIKTNNPHNLVLRKGDVFFERDEKRAIFNYWTKSFLSGVVSSIGAVNNKKKIKRMQEDNLRAIKEQQRLEEKNKPTTSTK